MAMVAATVTLWLSFAVWISADHFGLPRPVARTAAGILVAELVALLVSSYACEGLECSALGAAVGTVARIDIPLFALVFVIAAAVRARLVARRP